MGDIHAYTYIYIHMYIKGELVNIRQLLSFSSSVALEVQVPKAVCSALGAWNPLLNLSTYPDTGIMGFGLFGFTRLWVLVGGAKRRIS